MNVSRRDLAAVAAFAFGASGFRQGFRLPDNFAATRHDRFKARRPISSLAADPAQLTSTGGSVRIVRQRQWRTLPQVKGMKGERNL